MTNKIDWGSVLAALYLIVISLALMAFVYNKVSCMMYWNSPAAETPARCFSK